MNVNRKVIAIGAASVAISVAGVGIANAVGGDSEEQVAGPSAEKARAAAVKAVGGGKVTEVERQDGDGAGVFEVEVERRDGSQVEVHIDGRYEPVGRASDDDSGSESDEDAEEGSEDHR